MTKHYSLELRRTKHKTGPDALDEPDLLYLACKFGGEREDFVRGPLERPRDWWHARMNWLVWMTTADDCTLRRDKKVAALRLSLRIEMMLDGEPSRVDAPTPAAPVGKQMALF